MTELPEGARPIDVSELLACIGELYLQNRILRETIQKAQLSAAPSNGTVSDLISERRD